MRTLEAHPVRHHDPTRQLARFVRGICSSHPLLCDEYERVWSSLHPTKGELGFVIHRLTAVADAALAHPRTSPCAPALVTRALEETHRAAADHASPRSRHRGDLDHALRQRYSQRLLHGLRALVEAISI